MTLMIGLYVEVRAPAKCFITASRPVIGLGVSNAMNSAVAEKSDATLSRLHALKASARPGTMFETVSGSTEVGAEEQAARHPSAESMMRADRMVIFALPNEPR